MTDTELQSEDIEIETPIDIPAIEPSTQSPGAGVELPAMATYEVDQLNYLRDITEDKYHDRILSFIQHSSFTPQTKDALTLLVFTYMEPIDFAVTNIRSDRELKRFYDHFRMARKKFKCGIQQRDDTNLLAQILDHMESHLKIRLSRSKAGFERMEQSSIRQHQMQTGNFTQTQQSAQREDSISQLFKRND